MDNNSNGFVIICSALVMIMTPGIGMFYSGLSQSKNSLSIFILSFLTYCIVSIQWVLFGFSLSFSETGNYFIGNCDYCGFNNVINPLLLTAPAISGIVFALYQLQFATVTVSIIFGSVMTRIRIIPLMLFILIWITVVYSPIAYWTWGAHGWIRNMSCLNNNYCQIGGLDFAGGGPVHINSGAASLAFSIFLGKTSKIINRSHNNILILISTALIWMGWYGFNAGSAIIPSARAGYAGVVTTVAASSSGLTWILLDYINTKKISSVGLCSGIIVGLVGITPGAGFVNAWASIIIGIITALCCYLSIYLSKYFSLNDEADVWSIHGIGGIIGSICTGIFATNSITMIDNTMIIGGLVDGNGYLLLYNIIGSISILLYSFITTLLILFLINKLPYCKFLLNIDTNIELNTYECVECV